jgi:hypothetical protein
MPPRVHQAGALLPVQVTGKPHVAEPGDGEDALQLQPPLDGVAHRGGVAFMRVPPTGQARRLTWTLPEFVPG